jgi:hypothetical protein
VAIPVKASRKNLAGEKIRGAGVSAPDDYSHDVGETRLGELENGTLNDPDNGSSK